MSSRSFTPKHCFALFSVALSFEAAAISYVEGDGNVALTYDTSVFDGANYAGGFVEFNISNSTVNDQLSLLEDSAPDVSANAVSIVEGIVYLGNGSVATAVGAVDAVANGSDGRALRVNLVNAFENGDFSQGNAGDIVIQGWTTDTSGPIFFGQDTIAGLPTPIDSTTPASSAGDTNVPVVSGNYDAMLDTETRSGSGLSVELSSSGIRTLQGFDIVRGPAIFSNGAVVLAAGDEVSFDWRALGGGDAYDVYGYIIDINTNHIEVLLDETGADDTATSPWVTESITVSQAGEYRFVFVAGTYDFTGGRLAGAQLYVDDVTVTQSVAPAAFDAARMVDLSHKLRFENANDDIDTTTRNVSITAEDSLAQQDTTSTNITIAAVNDVAAIQVNNGAVVAEGGSVVLDASALDVIDPDDSDADLQYTLTTLPANGGLLLQGAALTQGSTFTQADIEAGRLSYQHDGSDTLSDTFGFDLSDGTAVSSDVFAIQVNTDTDDDGLPDVIDDDDDGDGIPDVDEGSGDSDGDGIDDSLDPDTDNDGIPDYAEGAGDLDGDGISNAMDLDSDGDGIPDSVELRTGDADNDGIDDAFDVDQTGGTDSNGDGIDDNAKGVDSDGDGQPDYLDIDADNDGIPDAIEGSAEQDADADGIDDAFDVDQRGGDDSNADGIADNARPIDTDGDGIADYLDLDTDNDGILDSVEAQLAGEDVDGDGIDDAIDADITGLADNNNDGIADNSLVDTDNDGRQDFRDLDSDNDSIPDVTEAGLSDDDRDGMSDNSVTTDAPQDSDADQRADYVDVDADEDGSNDIEQAGNGALDGDGDGRIDDVTDKDIDGIADIVDTASDYFGLHGGDKDNDGVLDHLDRDDDNDGISDAAEGDGDHDKDGVADRSDRDSDNDGLPDKLEAGQVRLSGEDSNNNGIDDALDAEITGGADSNGDGVDDAYAPLDTDNDGVPNYLDNDSDNDGLSDLYEVAGVTVTGKDDDNDGIDNAFDVDITGGVDANNDGVDDARVSPVDTDGDGMPDHLDTDSDNDGFDDRSEDGDFNNDGINDRLQAEARIETAREGGGGASGPLFGLLLLLTASLRKMVRLRRR
jgi:hypothetical protein